MEVSTQNCHRFDHPEFRLRCRDESLFAESLNGLAKWLESEVAAGKRFSPDQKVQVGWSILKVVQQKPGIVTLFEPDFKSFPIAFVDGISMTLLHLILQKSTNESLGLPNEIAFPSLLHSAIVCTKFGNSNDLILTRDPGEQMDSGWFLGCDDEEHDHQTVNHLKRVTLYEAASLDDRIIPYLGLPAGITCSLKSVPHFFLNEKELPIRPNSYLAQKFKL